MWVATREASRGGRKRPAKSRPLGLAELAKQLGGIPEAINYNRLIEEYPEVELGPDEDRLDHLRRLKRQRDFWRSTDTTEVDRRAADPRAQVRDEPNANLPAWMTLREQDQQSSPAPEFTPHSGLPHRIPGWYTGDAMDAPPPGYGTPPMSRRDPGATTRSPVSRPAVQPSQSYEDWVKWLGTKGIHLDLNGQRMSPQQMELPKRPLLTGPKIWHQFVDTNDYQGRHRAARALVAAYVDAMLLDLDGTEIGKISSWEERS